MQSTPENILKAKLCTMLMRCCSSGKVNITSLELFHFIVGMILAPIVLGGAAGSPPVIVCYRGRGELDKRIVVFSGKHVGHNLAPCISESAEN